MLAVHRRGQFEHINNVHAAFQGYPGAVRVPPTLCNFDLDDVDRDNLYLDVARTNVPCVMLFCVPVLSGMAQRALVNAQRELDWIPDRLDDFSSYWSGPISSHSTLLAAASAASAAQAVLMDDRRTYEVVAFVPSVAALPLRLHFELHRMASDSGWLRGRSVDVWVTNSAMVARTTIARTSLSFTGQVLSVKLHSEPQTHRAAHHAVELYGSVDGGVSARLCRATSRTPLVVFASENLFGDIPTNAPSLASDILSMIHGSAYR
ncbi:unnamed protein product [Haemonchus placei]|uniref:Beta-galactosidase n=1 Tax=Haemonchus placei TaxID=6290 RepID=A0A0N4WCW7_HAEPC|nr:unnamed protein product [Haemonchus placei]